MGSGVFQRVWMVFKLIDDIGLLNFVFPLKFFKLDLIFEFKNIIWLVLGKTAIIWVSDAHDEMKPILIKESIDQLFQENELIVSPALTDVEGWTVLSADVLGRQFFADELNFVLVFFLAPFCFRHFYKDWQVLAFGYSITLGINFESPLDSIKDKWVWVDNTSCTEWKIMQSVLKVIVVGEKLLDGFEGFFDLERFWGFACLNCERCKDLIGVFDQFKSGLALNFLTNSVPVKFIELNFGVILFLHFFEKDSLGRDFFLKLFHE